MVKVRMSSLCKVQGFIAAALLCKLSAELSAELAELLAELLAEPSAELSAEQTSYHTCSGNVQDGVYSLLPRQQRLGRCCISATVVIGVSLSKPHTSESNGGFSYVIYLLYVVP